MKKSRFYAVIIAAVIVVALVMFLRNTLTADLYFNDHDNFHAGQEALKIPSPDKNGRIQTLNDKGKMSSVVDPATYAYLEFITESPYSDYMDIGCAYGFTVRKALDRKATKIYAIDLDKRHLQLMKDYIGNAFDLKKITAIPGDFPDDFESMREIPEESVRGVLLARVLHFYTGEKIERALDLLNRILEPEGKIFINVLSPYTGTAEKFAPIFEKNLAANAKYPGECQNPKDLGENFSAGISGVFHFFTPDTLRSLIEKHGFTVIKSEYANEMFDKSDSLRSDGRENVILIAQKAIKPA